jgi:Right handed beta helix region
VIHLTIIPHPSSSYKFMKITALLLALTTTISIAQGPLNPPPGGPTTTMKSLDQIEARTPIPATVTPAAGPHFTITQPGSYYLTGNITVTSGDGILITADRDVSIDLNGFTIASTRTGSFDGRAIALPDQFSRLTVRNGSIWSGTTVSATAAVNRNGFSYGIYSTGALVDSLISGVHVSGCAGSGIYLDNEGIVENCTASHNGDDGIFCAGGVVTGCTARLNGASGIVAIGSSVTNSRASRNGGPLCGHR